MQGQILFRDGDMFKEEFHISDVVEMGNILHDWNDEKKRILFKHSLSSCLKRIESLKLFYVYIFKISKRYCFFLQALHL